MPDGADLNAAGHVTNPCLNATLFGINWGLPEPAITGFYILGFGISILAIFSSLTQLVASRMTLPPHDPTRRRTTRTSSCSARWPTSCR